LIVRLVARMRCTPAQPAWDMITGLDEVARASAVVRTGLAEINGAAE
jgi:hypothetical protein